MRILIVDDDEIVKSCLSDLLRSLNHTVDCLSDGKEMYKLLSYDSVYDVVISDIVMPNMYGLEASELSKTFGNTTPIIFISGYSNEDIENIKYFLRKPFEQKELLDMINRAVLENKSNFI